MCVCVCVHAHTIIQVTYYVVTFPVEYKVNIHYYSMDVVNLQKEEPEPRREEKRGEEKGKRRRREEKRREERRREEKLRYVPEGLAQTP